MDEDTRKFLEQIAAALEHKIEATAAALKSELKAEIGADLREGLASLRTPIVELRHSVATYASINATTLKNITSTQVDVSMELDDLRRRVAALESRLPPPQATA